MPVLGDANLLGGVNPEGLASLLTGKLGLGLLGVMTGGWAWLSNWGLSQLPKLEEGGLGMSVEERS